MRSFTSNGGHHNLVGWFATERNRASEYLRSDKSFPQEIWKADCLSRTSVITIANENISDSLLRIPRSPETKISGAAHRASSQWPAKASRIENGFWLITEIPIPVIRAQLEASTRMLGWVGINKMTRPRNRTVAYSLEVPKNHTTRVEIVETFGNVEHLALD